MSTKYLWTPDIANEYPQAHPQKAPRINVPTALEEIRAARDVSDVAHLIGFRPKSLAYILYGIPDESKYHTFDIPKKSGGIRKIDAPIDQLKLAQRRLHDLLSRCLVEIEIKEKLKEECAIAHGFHAKRSIFSNAKNHRGRRWVFNIDLKDFFPSINFGRVRGYLIKNKYFKLDETAATIIAQIICHQNTLPQGSPTSPIVSNLVANILDMRLNRLATRHRCSYTRYADDLTFSCGKKNFPPQIASPVDGEYQKWGPSDQLRYHIFQSGFSINETKTRMQYYWSRQDVTGLIVNKKVGVKREYIKLARARCDHLFANGTCTEKVRLEGKELDQPYEDFRLRGMLSHIFSIKGEEFEHARFKENSTSKKIPGFYRMYRQFLDYTAFAANETPTILFEGKTDHIYFRCALKNLAPHFPSLVEKDELKIRLFKYSPTSDAVQHLKGGTGDLRQFIFDYIERIKSFPKAPFQNPVIIIVDNDEGSKGKKGLFEAVKNVSKVAKVDGTKSFYYVAKNIYVVPTPLIPKSKNSKIEDFLPPAILSIELNKKKFHPSDEGFDPRKHFGKAALAEYVNENSKKLDLNGFTPILTAVADCIDHYRKS